MPEKTAMPRPHEQWAYFRFSLIGPLLAAPPARGQLQARLQELAGREWYHPISGQWVRFGLSTIERWYYSARNQKRDPVAVLQRKIRSDSGEHPSLSSKLRQVLAAQYRQHPQWSYQLHTENLAVEAEQHPELGAMPSYGSVLRFMKKHGLLKRPRRGPATAPGAQRAEERFQTREVRSYQSEYVHALWHLDFHHGSLRVLRPQGEWTYPILLGMLDDRSRLCCHVQWYFSEKAEELCHGLCQGFQKYELPRALMSDNGSAMIAAEIVQGLQRLGIVHERTLPYSPYQNGKQEVFWGQVEGRLLAMLEGVRDLTLQQLNQATLAWVEIEYNRRLHSELGQTPLECLLHERDVGRPSPSSEELSRAFTAEIPRAQRRSDGTIILQGVRFEIPARYAHFSKLTVRFASWNLGQVHLSDPRTGTILCRLYPQDKRRNAEGRRPLKASPLAGSPHSALAAGSSSGMAPLLKKILQQYAATGLPPAYLPKEETSTPENPS